MRCRALDAAAIAIVAPLLVIERNWRAIAGAVLATAALVQVARHDAQRIIDSYDPFGVIERTADDLELSKSMMTKIATHGKTAFRTSAMPGAVDPVHNRAAQPGQCVVSDHAPCSPMAGISSNNLVSPE